MQDNHRTDVSFAPSQIFISSRYVKLASFAARADFSDQVLKSTSSALDLGMLPAEALLSMRIYEHPKDWQDWNTPAYSHSGESTLHLGEAASASSFFAIAGAEADDEVRRQNRQLAEFCTSSDGHRYSRSSHTHPNDVQHPNDPEDGDYPELPKYNEGRIKMTNLMLDEYPREVVFDSWRSNGRSNVEYDSGGVWQGPCPELNIQCIKYSKRYCFGCVSLLRPMLRPILLWQASTSDKDISTKEGKSPGGGRSAGHYTGSATSRKAIGPNVERTSSQIQLCPISAYNGPMKHILCSASIIRAQRKDHPGEVFIFPQPSSSACLVRHRNKWNNCNVCVMPCPKHRGRATHGPDDRLHRQPTTPAVRFRDLSTIRQY
ncbi:BQ5605_C030g10835 [Microbotryum silenes-dioicae]|uniref:BQ5605_C030g10835 protein n=1 Tax=Microbotryum silenes-dioicae TaxID=796604 RepID=A0A2X0PIC6_9BASI|nr:BQ5605_C030g10835 [Microbotryum silenes-dioicae]